MSSKKKPKTPESGLPEQPIEVVSEVIAQAIGQMKGLSGADLNQTAKNVRAQVQGLVSDIEKHAENPDTRQMAAAEVRKLIELFANVGGLLGGAMAVHSAPIQKALQGADMQKPAEALRLLADYLQNPSPEREAEVKQKVAEIETKYGALAGRDAVAEEQRRKDEIKADVQRSLDSIFGKIKPPE